PLSHESVVAAHGSVGNTIYAGAARTLTCVSWNSGSRSPLTSERTRPYTNTRTRTTMRANRRSHEEAGPFFRRRQAHYLSPRSVRERARRGDHLTRRRLRAFRHRGSRSDARVDHEVFRALRRLVGE